MKSERDSRRYICRLKDPLPYMAKYPEADILTSSDHLVNLHCRNPPSLVCILSHCLASKGHLLLCGQSAATMPARSLT